MLPFSSIGERFDEIARFGTVYAILIFFIVIEILAFPDPFSSLQFVPFLMISVYFWALYRPNVLPPLLVFIFGLLVDVMSGLPIGVGAIILVLLNWAISEQRAFLSAQSFAMKWLVFGMVYLVIVIVQWMVLGLINFEWSSIAQIIPQFIVGMVAFPFVMIIHHLAYKILPSPNFTLTSR